MNIEGLDLVADVLRETAEPLPDGERRTLLLGLSEVFKEAAVRMNDGIATPVLIEDAPPAIVPEPVEATSAE